MGARDEIVPLCYRMTALVGCQGEISGIINEHVRLFVNDHGSIRTLRVRVHTLRCVGRGNEDTHERPRILMLLYVRDIRRTRQVVSINAVLARVVTIMLPFRIDTDFLVDPVIYLNRSLSIQFRIYRRFLLNSTTRYARVVIRTSILRVVRFTRSTRLTRLTSTNSRRGTGVLPRPLRKN